MTKVYSSALLVPFDSVISGLSLLISLQTFLCFYLSFHKMLCALYLYLFLLHDFCFFIIFLFPMKDTKQFYNFLLVFIGNHFQGFMSLQEDVLLLLLCNMNSWYHVSLYESWNVRTRLKTCVCPEIMYLPTNNVQKYSWSCYLLILVLISSLFQMANWKQNWDWILKWIYFVKNIILKTAISNLSCSPPSSFICFYIGKALAFIKIFITLWWQK